MDAFAGHLVVSYRRDALSRVGVIDLASPEPPRPAGLPTPIRTGDTPAPTADLWHVHEVAFDEPLYTAALGANPEWDQPNVRLGYTSFVTPSTVYDLRVETDELTLLKQQPVLGGYDAADYVQRREWATAEDGTQVPVSLVWRRDAVGLDATGTGAEPAPLLLYGYGSYEISIDPGFSISRLSLLDRGRVRRRARPRRRRDGAAGTTRARRSPSAPRSRTSSRSRGTSSTRAGRARSGSSRRAARRAACSWAR